MFGNSSNQRSRLVKVGEVLAGWNSSERSKSKHSAAVLSLALAVMSLMALTPAARAQCTSPANAVVAENCLPGNPASQWDIRKGDAGDPTIQGFATDISFNQGQTVSFKISTPASRYTIDIYRMGYYAGLGARKVASILPSATLPQTQPTCITDPSVGLSDCGNWAVSATWPIPANAVSGIYFAHLIRTDTGGDSHIVFIVRNDSSHSDILFQTADEAWQAYNSYGSGSLYGPAGQTFDINQRSYKVSYNRPFLTRGFADESDTWVFGAEFPMVEWLESNGYDVSYFTGVDAARSGSLIANHKLYMDSGHDEYWSGPQRASVAAARDLGVNLAFFSGNEMFWKTRWENSIDGTNTPDRTLVCYKETLANKKLDSANPALWTGTWRDPRYSPPADGGKPENALTGTLYTVNGPGADNDGTLTIKIPAALGKMRFWRNTAVASLADGASYTLPTGSLGYEWDIDADNGIRPAGVFHLSSSTYNLSTDLLLDYGGTYGAGVATHTLDLYRAKSGALVFGAGTVNWSWGLNAVHDNPFPFSNTPPNPVMQQSTVNLFADMGVQPHTLNQGLALATASADATPPVSTISLPTSGSKFILGTPVQVSGVAHDNGGGIVAGVEVSVDGGGSWHPATGLSTWSYTWDPKATGPVTLLSRAVDDSGNLESPGAGASLTITPRPCPCSVWQSSTVPAVIDGGDGSSIEVGLKFRADNAGFVTGLRFYKAATNKGTHTGHLWSGNGTLLGSATFVSETTSGWQQINFPTPIPVAANTTYVASYFAPAGHYSVSPNFFATAGTDNPPLHALVDGADGSNAVYVYSSYGAFPTSSYNSANYWVDVIYTSGPTYSISGSVTGNGAFGATVALSGAATTAVTVDSSGNYSFSGLADGTYTVSVSNPGVTFTPANQSVSIVDASTAAVNFSSTLTNPLTIAGTITGGASATVTLTGAANAVATADSSGNYAFSQLLPGSYTVIPSKAGYLASPASQAVSLAATSATAVNFSATYCNCTSIWPTTALPAVVDTGDTSGVELGVKFRVDEPGSITGFRFYKSAANVGTHVAHLWTTSGMLLGSATFSAEGPSGWQEVTLPTPIQVTANTTYVASYFAPAGHYSADAKYFATHGVDQPPLHALGDGVDGADGLYVYSSSGGFPTNTYNSANYWIDVLFQAAQPNNISGSISGPLGANATMTLQGSSRSFATTASSGSYGFTGIYSGSYSLTPSAPGAVFSPGNQNIVVAGTDVTGINFAVPTQCPCSTLWQPSYQPSTADFGDPNSYELGVKFRADSDGYVLGVRFYKSSSNTGTHVGNLWSTDTGALLASATFTNESASGWQQVLFTNPVSVTAGTTYTASYFAPKGHYSGDARLFASAGVDSPPLHALANGLDGGNGVYAASSVSGFPSSSYNATSYGVDVIYAANSNILRGTLTGPGSAGAVVTLSGTGLATTTTDSAGRFFFTHLARGTYTIKPHFPAASSVPRTQSVTLGDLHKVTLDFSSSASNP